MRGKGGARTADAGGDAGPIRVLLVHGDPEQRRRTAEGLERESDRMAVETAPDAAAGLEVLAGGGIDSVVSGHDLPDRDGPAFLEAVRDRDPDLPFVLYTGGGSEAVASRAISAGVTDYVRRDGDPEEHAVLANRIEGAVERRRATAALAEREKRLSLFVDQSPLGVIEWNEEFELVRMNPAAEEILGYERADLAGETWEAIVPESDRAAVADVVEELLADRGGYHSVNENVRPDGETVVCEWHNRVVTDDDGEVVAVFSQFQDVTDRERRKRELEETNAVLSALLENLPVGVLVEDADREILAANTTLPELFGVDAAGEQLVGRDCESALGEFADAFADPDAVVGRTGELLARREPAVGERVELADGRVLERSYVPYEMPGGDANLWLYRDVTDREDRERKLRAVQERTRELMHTRTKAETARVAVEAAGEVLEAPLSGVHLLDEDGTALAPAATTESVEAALGEAPTYRLDDDGPVSAMVWEAFEAGEPRFVDDPDERPELAAATPARSGGVYPLGDHGVFVVSSTAADAFDGTDRTLAEILATALRAALDRSEREALLRERERRLQRENERLDTFASIVSHDLRSPLNVATGRVELAAEEYDGDHLAEALDALERMETLVTDLLALAREGGEVEETVPLALADVARGCWGNVETGDAELRVAGDRRIPAEESRLAQLLENLFRNAVEHAGEDVTVTVGPLPDGEGFYVEDDGPGIPAGDRDRAFETGYSTAEGNTGLGLGIVREVVEAHGWGVAAVESAEGGARFEVTGVGAS